MRSPNEVPSVSFFYPSKVLGGAEILFTRLATIIANDWGIEVYYIDYVDGYARSLLANKSNVKFLTFDLTFGATGLPLDTVVITPLSSIVDIASYLGKNNFRILFWSIHPVGLQSFLQMGFRKLRIERYMPKLEDLGVELDLLVERKALVFMDEANFDYQKKVFAMDTEKPSFLPILCEDADIKKVYEPFQKVIRLAWLGRLSIEKTYSLLHILNNCNSYLSRYQDVDIQFHIIGTGECEHMVREFINHEKLNLVTKTNLTGNKLNTYLVDNVDILFAMGTSALEGASMNIATVLVDFSYKTFDSWQKFRWLYETKGYSLGSLAETNLDKKHFFDDIIQTLYDNSVGTYAVKCYDYFLTHHHSKIVAAKINICLQQTQFTNHDLLKSRLKKYLWINTLRKIFHYLKTL